MSFQLNSARLKQVENAFYDNFTHRGDLGASLCIHYKNEPVLSLAHGYEDRTKTIPWTEDSHIPCWSATKGPACASLLLLLQNLNIPVTTPIADIWPEFSQENKAPLTIQHFLSHQTGLAGLTSSPIPDAFSHPQVAEALAAQKPLWAPTKAHGYHPRTFGYPLEELHLRLTNHSLGHFWLEHFAAPLQLPFYIGNPPTPVAPIFPPKSFSPPDEERNFYQALKFPGSISQLAFASPSGFKSFSTINSPEYQKLSLPAFGGVGSAFGLSKFYAYILNSNVLPLPLFTDPLVNGDDLTLLRPTSFSHGFMKDPTDRSGQKLRDLFGPETSAFGHPGAGGSHAFADPVNNLTFAYVMNQMDLGILPTTKAHPLVKALYYA